MATGKMEGKAEGRSPVVCRDLMCAEEWSDPEGREVVAEYHKEGLAQELPQIEKDLELFEKYWHRKGAINMRGEYHKAGAPHVEKPSGWEGHALRSKDGSEILARPTPPPVKEQPKKEKQVKEEKKPAPPPAADEDKKTINRPIDLSTAEIVSYALFRMVFGHGISVPIKREGLVDMDVTVKGKDIVINTNQMFFGLPELSVWRVIYSHKNKPILEFGRGVKDGMRIHRFNALMLVLEVWRGNMKQKKLKAKLKAGTEEE